MQSPQDYQPEAIHATQTLLNGRLVSKEDRMDTERYLSQLAAEVEKRCRAINQLKVQAETGYSGGFCVNCHTIQPQKVLACQ